MPVPLANATVRDRSSLASFSRKTEPSNFKKLNIIARAAAEPFSPNRITQRLNQRQYSPAVVTKAVCTATATRSFEDAAKVLSINTCLKISPRHLQTLCQEVGGELVDKQETRTNAYRDRPLNAPATSANPPIPLAVVMVDGGRMQTRKPGCGPGVHEAAWRESKTAIFLRATHESFAFDPQPDLPKCFAHPLKTAAETPLDLNLAADPEPIATPAIERQILFRTGLATLKNSDEFGRQTAAAADARGFFSAAVQAYVCDGQAYNWTIHRRHFASFEPILDFMHASEHIHNAARALSESGKHWAELCWQGDVSKVLTDMEEHISRLTPPAAPENEPEHIWCVLKREHGYLKNNRERMDYPRYRREGLPITSSPVESWVKQLNQRVKGSEKFWNDSENAEAILHLRTAWLGDDEELMEHLKNRPGHPHARPREETQLSMAA